VAIQNAIPPQVMGSATGVATFFRQMGGTLGIAVAGTVFASAMASADQPGKVAFTEGIRAVYLLALGLAALALVLTLMLPSLPLRRTAAVPTTSS